MKKVLILTTFLAISSLTSLAFGAKIKGVLGQKAPEINDLDWFGPGNKSVKIPSIKEHKGKVVILKFWQSWCPGCLRKGLPDLKTLQDHFKNNKNVKIYSAQTVFEGGYTNTKDKLESIRKEYGLTIPMAHDDGSKFKLSRSVLMNRFRTRGTPWFVIIDTNQKVVFNDFHLDAKKTIEFVEKTLLAGKKEVRAKKTRSNGPRNIL